jgi:hypothetical protein
MSQPLWHPSPMQQQHARWVGVLCCFSSVQVQVHAFLGLGQAVFRLMAPIAYAAAARQVGCRLVGLQSHVCVVGSGSSRS